MPKENTPEAEIAEFDLKHRITGAAVLLFLGALVLPWLLGPPSEASKSSPDSVVSDAQNYGADIEPVAVNDDSGKLDVVETVYISKITPVDAKSSSLAEAANKAAGQSVAKQTLNDDTSSADELKAKEAEKLAKAAKQKVAQQQASEKAANAEAKKTREDREEKAKADALKQREAAELAKREKDLQDALAAETKNQAPNNQAPKQQKPSKTVAKIAPSKPKVDVGWVVQVGLFTEKDRALAFISELKSKGFDASSTIVDTNRGKNTGTRVWLGPFAKRVSANNEQKRLMAKAGKEGFIRVYP